MRLIKQRYIKGVIWRIIIFDDVLAEAKRS
jgi:hypothetical protein